MSIQQLSKQLQDQIFKEHYYVDLYGYTLERANLTAEDVEDEKLSSKQLTSLWRKFWFSLPDHSAIRRGPFFTLCDICETEA